MVQKTEINKLAKQFSRQGYVVIDELIPTNICEKIVNDIKLVRQNSDFIEVNLSGSNFETINGSLLLNQIPEIKSLHEACKEIASSITGKMLEELENKQIGISLNVIHPKNNFQLHYDRNEITIVLYLNTVEGGGMKAFPRFRVSSNPASSVFLQRILNRLESTKQRISFFPFFKRILVQPLPGRAFIFEGKETLHSVTVVNGETSRFSLQFAYDIDGSKFTKKQTKGYYGYQ